MQYGTAPQHALTCVTNDGARADRRVEYANDGGRKSLEYSATTPVAMETAPNPKNAHRHPGTDQRARGAM